MRFLLCCACLVQDWKKAVLAAGAGAAAFCLYIHFFGKKLTRRERRTAEKEARALFKEMDLDGDGNLSYSEIMTYIREHKDGKLAKYIMQVTGEHTSRRHSPVSLHCG